MKDLPHHMQKLNRRVIRSMHREQTEEETFDSGIPFAQTPRQEKKQAKAMRAKDHESHTPIPLTPDEQNKKMAKRVPIFFDRNHLKPKTTRPTRKKTARITKAKKSTRQRRK